MTPFFDTLFPCPFFDLYQIKSFVQKIGTNPLVRGKSAHFAAPVPSQFVPTRRALLPTPAPSARASSTLSDSEVSFCGGDVPKLEPIRSFHYSRVDKMVRDLRRIYKENPDFFEIPAFARKVY